MKKLLFFLAFSSLLFSACETTNEEVTSTLTITSSTEVNLSSGNAVGVILYEIANPSAELTVEAKANVDWITDFNYKDFGKITYFVAENRAADPRTGVITVTYGNDKLNVVINQEGSDDPKDKLVEAPMLVGQYYGNQIPGYELYYLAFSDKGMSSYEIETPTFNYWNVPDATYYFLYILTDTKPLDERCQLPDGVYTLGSGGVMNSINTDTSWLQVNDSTGFPWTQSDYESAELTVQDGTLTLRADILVMYKDEDWNMTYEEETHTVTYSGDYSLVNLSEVVYQ